MSNKPSTKRGVLLMTAILVAALLIPMFSTSAQQAVNVDIRGSTTVWPIMDVARYQIPVLFPDTTLTIARTGSGDGKRSVLRNLTDIGMASAPCVPGTDDVPPAIISCAQATETRIARDALSIVVHSSKTCVTDISRTQLKGIYEGTITNWNQISASCPSQTIVPRARIIGSGTRQSFMDLACPSGGCPINDAAEQATINATGLPRLLGNQEMEEAIGDNTDGSQIGYVGLAFLDPDIRALSVEGVFPSVATVEDGSYRLSRSLYLYTIPPELDPDPAKPRIQDVLNWATGFRGQSVVINEGFVAVAPAAPNWDVTADFVANILDMSSIGTVFLAVPPPTGLDPPNDVTYGWVRANVVLDRQVNILDLATVGGRWLQTWTP